ncbi:MAG TPA: GTP-binding protein [Planctomycetota bacterium]|nr:GTP-binding protein [Planctomycetota bacterium]
MDRLRTFGIVAHIDAGKTTLTERILFDAGAQTWVGNVDDGTAAMDWMPAERSRGISITAAATRVQWGEHVLQVVDTPGHVDFVAEVERCLFVLDGVVVLVDGVRGVESQTEVVWQQAASRGLPRLLFVNKLDRIGADFDAVLAELPERLDCRPLAFVVPLRDAEGRFAGLGDALTGAVQWFEGRPEPPLAARLQAEIRAAHERAVEVAADADAWILGEVVAGRAVPVARLRAVLRAEFLAGRIVPVLCGAALWNRGVDWLLDAVGELLPALAELPRQGLWAIDRAGDPAAPFCGFVFKVQHGHEVWNFVRVVRGQMVPGASWCRGRQPVAVGEIAELWLVQADRHRPTPLAVPGEIVVLPGELGLRTGDTVCDPQHPVVLPAPRFPAPVLAVTFEPARDEDRQALAAALRALAVDDPTLRVEREHDRLVVRGMGELHLDIVAELVRARTGVAFQQSKPRVDRRETVGARAAAEAEVRAVVGGVERSARCGVAIAPAADAASPAVVHGTDGAADLVEVLDELRSMLAAGFRVGPMVGVQVTLCSLVAEGGASAGPLAQQAAAKALAAAVGLADLVELEPWVTIEVWCPEDAAAAVRGDLGARGAVVSSVSSGRLGARLRGRAPLARMLGYVTKLRSMTKGRGQVSMRPSGYSPVR